MGQFQPLGQILEVSSFFHPIDVVLIGYEEVNAFKLRFNERLLVSVHPLTEFVEFGFGDHSLYHAFNF